MGGPQAFDGVIAHVRLICSKRRYLLHHVKLGCTRPDVQPGAQPAETHSIVLKVPRGERELERVVKGRLLSDLVPKSYEEMARELRREVRMLMKCQGPNIVEVGPRAAPGCPAVLSWNQQPAIALRKYDFSLRELVIDSRGALSPKLICSYAAQLIKGVAHCHRMGVNHNDISLDNVLLNKKGKLALADFEHASSMVCLGKLWYTAPELVLMGRSDEVRSNEVSSNEASSDEVSSNEVSSNDVTAWQANRLPLGQCDVWSVGMVIIDMMSRCPIFPGDSYSDQLRRICQGLGSPTEASWPDHSKYKGWDPAFEQFTTRARVSELLKGNLGVLRKTLRENQPGAQSDFQLDGQPSVQLYEWLLELCDVAVCYPAERASSAELLERIPKNLLEIVSHVE